MAAFLFVVTIPLEPESDSVSQVFQSDDEDLRSEYDRVNGDVLAKKLQKESCKEGDDVSTVTEFFDARSVTSSPRHGDSEWGSLQGTLDAAGIEDDDQVKVLPKQDSLATTECESFTLEEVNNMSCLFVGKQTLPDRNVSHDCVVTNMQIIFL